MTPALLLLLPHPALAGTVVAHSENFDSYTTSSFSGSGGWTATIAGTDPWSAASGDGVYAKTDNPGGTWGGGSNIDNHLRYTSDTYADFTMDVVVNSNDDDTIGVVFRYTDAKNFYLAFWTRAAYPNTGTGGDVTASSGTARLYKVVAGSATLLDSYATSYTSSVDYDLRVVTLGSSLTVWFDLDRDGVWDTGEDLLAAADTAHTTGQVGFYCYDNGNGSGCVFDDFVISLEDTDGDGIADVDDPDVDGDGATSGADCDDLDASRYPGAAEVCDGVDQDCDGATDDGTSCYDDDGDGFTEDEGDCDDGDGGVAPGAAETCDGVDQDCDGTADDSPIDDQEWFADGDSDGVGGASLGFSCAAPAGAASTSGDCDDAAGDVFPGASETCDGVDQDCDGATDEEATDTILWYLDVDGDGFSGDSTSISACSAPSSSWHSASDDCDDLRPEFNPGATEVCDGEDGDCDGAVDESASDASTWFLDDDGDGYGDPNIFIEACSAPPEYTADDTDCDDLAFFVNPAATEIDDNGIDEDCDGADGIGDTDPGDTDTGDTDDTDDTDPGDTDTGDTDTGGPGDTDVGDTDPEAPATSSRGWAPEETGGQDPVGAGCGCVSGGPRVPALLGWVTLLAILTRRSRRER